MNTIRVLNRSEVQAIEGILAKGDRVELIPTKDGVRVIRIRREEVGRKSEYSARP